MRTLLLILFLSIAGLHQLKAAQSVICGQISLQNGDPLPGVNIYLKGTFDGTSTNADGQFRLLSNKSGAYYLKIELMGFSSDSVLLQLPQDSIYRKINLKEKFNQLKAVTIQSGSFEAGDKRRSVTLSQLDMVSTAGSLGGVYGALQMLPGTSPNGESGRLFVKGGDSNESQTYINGAWVPLPYEATAPFHSARGRFNPFLFKGMVFSTDAYSAEYGQALSSVLLLDTKDRPQSDRLDISMLSIGPELSGTKLWKGGAITASGTYSNLRPYMQLIPQRPNWKKEPVNKGAEISIEQDTPHHGHIKSYTSLSTANFSLYQTSLSNPTENILYQSHNKNLYSNLIWKQPLAQKLSSTLSASVTKDANPINHADSLFKQNTSVFFLKESLHYAISDRLLLNTGLEWVYNHSSESLTLSNDFQKENQRENQLAGFAELKIYSSNRFVNRIGMRTEYTGFNHQLTAAPRLASALKLGQTAQLTAAGGLFYQLPGKSYRYESSKLQNTRALQYSLTLLSSKNQRTFRAELYSKTYRKLITYTAKENWNYTNLGNEGKGYARGLDLFWRDKQSIKNGDYWISYSFIDSRRDYHSFPRMATPSYVSKNNLSIVYKHWISGFKSLVSLNFSYSSPRHYNNPNSDTFNTEKMPAYKTLDLSWSYLYRPNIIIYGAVTNVPGFKNSYGRRYAVSPDSNGIYRSELILPSARRFFVVACLITLSRGRHHNQLNEIN